MKKSFLFLSFFTLITIIAVLTNPDRERHKEVIKNKVNIAMQKSMTRHSGSQASTGQALGMMLGGFFIDNIIDQMISIDNYVLFSTTKVTMDGETHVVGIGIFGNVFVTNEIDEFLENVFSEENR